MDSSHLEIAALAVLFLFGASLLGMFLLLESTESRCRSACIPNGVASVTAEECVCLPKEAPHGR